MALHNYYVIRVSCPMQARTYLPEARDFETLKAGNPSLRRLLDFLGDQDIDTAAPGIVGAYKGVCEIVPSFGVYTPGEGAHPVHGQAHHQSAVASVYLTTYAPAAMDEAALNAYCMQIAALHEWEHPVIEVTCPDGRFMVWMPD